MNTSQIVVVLWRRTHMQARHVKQSAEPVEQSAEPERSIQTLTDQHQAASDCVQAARRKKQSMPHPSFVTYSHVNPPPCHTEKGEQDTRTA
jgi:hypothetical protein